MSERLFSRTARHAAIVIVLVLGGNKVLAALPDWAKAVIAAAPPLPEGTSPETSRVLFAETRVLVKPNGHLEIRRRLANQALSDRADKVGYGVYRWDADARVESSRAWHLPPGQKAEKSDQWDEVDVALDNGAFTSDNTLRSIRMGGIKRGSIVFFEFKATETPHLMSWLASFWEGEPVLRSTYELELPEGWSVRTAWLHTRGPDSVTSGSKRTWTLQNLPGSSDDPLSEPASSGVPLLVVSVAPPPGTTLTIPVVPDWVAFASWYEGIAKGRDAADSEIVEASKKILQGSGPQALDRVLAAAAFVRDRVRYVAKEVGIGAFQPRPAKDTLVNLYGDCKDKGTLLRALLSADGHASYPVLINLGLRDVVSDEVPAFQFNHFIVAVPIPPDVKIPARLSHGIVEAGDLGRLLIVDTTNESLSMGWISPALAGQKGLVIAGARARLVQLPQDTAAHRFERRLDVTVAPDRSLAMKLETRSYGQFAATARADVRLSSVERRKTIERRVARTWIGSEPDGYSIEDESSDGAFVETVSFKVPSHDPGGNGNEFVFFPEAPDLLPHASLQKRTTPVVYGWPRSFHFETSIHGGAHSPLPSPQKAHGDGWSSNLSFSEDEGVVHAVWDLELSASSFESEAFPHLKKLWATMNTAGSVFRNVSIAD